MQAMSKSRAIAEQSKRKREAGRGRREEGRGKRVINTHHNECASVCVYVCVCVKE
jgi:hypothetical protein